MIVFRIYGGLGNQLFQYAAARALSVEHAQPIRFEGSYFQREEKNASSWTYQLNKFAVATSQVDNCELKNRFPLLKYPFLLKVYRRLINVLPLFRRKYYFERSMAYDHDFFETNPECYVDGYFQSYKYFEKQGSLLMSELQPVEPPSEMNSKFLELVQANNSVSLHIRRGDYISSAAANKVHGVCSIEYYISAISEMRRKLGECRFFVFSDDISWAEENLRLDGEVHFLQHNSGDQSYWDLILMSHCEHNIIANSTFSWWGAWLNPNPQKTVIAPEAWFADDSKNTADLIPPSWIRI